MVYKITWDLDSTQLQQYYTTYSFSCSPLLELTFLYYERLEDAKNSTQELQNRERTNFDGRNQNQKNLASFTLNTHWNWASYFFTILSLAQKKTIIHT